MQSEYIEVICGNCRYWYPWKAFAVPGVLSECKVVQKGMETGYDGKCGCYKSGMTVGPTDSSDTLSAHLCDNYSPIGS